MIAVGLIDMGNSEKPKIVNESLAHMSIVFEFCLTD